MISRDVEPSRFGTSSTRTEICPSLRGASPSRVTHAWSATRGMDLSAMCSLRQRATRRAALVAGRPPPGSNPPAQRITRPTLTFAATTGPNPGRHGATVTPTADRPDPPQTQPTLADQARDDCSLAQRAGLLPERLSTFGRRPEMFHLTRPCPYQLSSCVELSAPVASLTFIINIIVTIIVM